MIHDQPATNAFRLNRIHFGNRRSQFGPEAPRTGAFPYCGPTSPGFSKWTRFRYDSSGITADWRDMVRFSTMRAVMMEPEFDVFPRVMETGEKAQDPIVVIGRAVFDETIIASLEDAIQALDTAIQTLREGLS